MNIFFSSRNHEVLTALRYCFNQEDIFSLESRAIEICVENIIQLIDLFSLISVADGPGGSMSWVIGLPNTSYKHITNAAWVRAQLCKLQKGCTRLAAASDKVYQLLSQGQWLSPGTLASSTTKTGRHDIAEILLKVALNTKIQILLFWE